VRASALRADLLRSKGGDPHPTDAGYRAMAGAFMAASRYPGKP
jgi:hypothetical protein